MRNIIISILAIALLYCVWVWGFERFYVKPNYMAVIESKRGN